MFMWRNNITFVIFAYNEEKRISYTVKNFIKYGEVVVIDNFSSDKTKEIAEELGATVYHYKNNWFVETQAELDFVRSKINTEYMTWSFADHMWSKKILEEVINITKESKYDGIATILKNYHYGLEGLTFMTYGLKGKSASQSVHVYKKECLFCTGIIHYSLQHTCKNIYHMPIGEEYMVHHLSVYNVKKFELWHSNYSDLEAKIRFDRGEKVSFVKLLGRIVLYFMKYYFWDWAWRSGIPGLIMVMQYLFFMFNIGAKQRELEHNVTLESVEESYNRMREKVLSDIEK